MAQMEMTPEQGLATTLAALEGNFRHAALEGDGTPAGLEEDSTLGVLKDGFAKMARIMLEDADTRIDAGGFFIRFASTGKESPYAPLGAAPGITLILAAARFEMPVRAPQRRLLEPSDLPSNRMFSDMDHSTLTVWIYPENHRVRMCVRSGVHDEPLEIKAWSPKKVYAVLKRSHACPHCGISHDQYRDLGGAFVCQACGRSFVPGIDLLLSVFEKIEDVG